MLRRFCPSAARYFSCSPDIVAAFVRCHAPYRLNQTRLESATPSCDRP